MATMVVSVPSYRIKLEPFFLCRVPCYSRRTGIVGLQEDLVPLQDVVQSTVRRSHYLHVMSGSS